MRNFLIPIFVLCFSLSAASQDAKLAQQYFSDGEFEKAAVLYKKLYDQQNKNDYYFDRYLECLLAVEKYAEVEGALKQGLRDNPNDVRLYVAYGNLYERQFNEEKSREQYEKAIKKMPADQYQITRLASAFTNLTKYDLAIKTYEIGGELLKNRQLFTFNLAELYRRSGDTEKMVENYLSSLEAFPQQMATIQGQLQRYLVTPEDYATLQTQLYDRIQQRPNDLQFVELLQWMFIQNKDYKNALRQARALDKRLEEGGARVYQLAFTAYNERDYAAAIEAFDYVVREAGTASPYYLDSKRMSLKARRNQLIEGYAYTEVQLREIEAAYETFLTEFGRSKVTASIIAELADLEAFYLNDLEKAIALLNEMISFPAVDSRTLANGKLSLGDFYLMKNEVWEATLLYSQVDKAFPDDQLGHEARFRNARLAYYNGDFQWAQTQFDVLKASTSKLIANDALDLSVFIMDNLGLDTTDRALRLYAESDLLSFQNRFSEAFAKLDTLLREFPKHSLEDDVLYARAKVYVRQREYAQAVPLFEQIVAQYPEEIRADNALFELAELYENQLQDLDKAMQYYEKIFLQYSSSTFSVEARKRFRKLRGDNI
ncbi:MAG: hypothetical protein RI973_2105 [Bacteroidota bacterium]|jgi:tetratricopeptide (TPR) repeat protein